jgi:YHS domain-containing protein
MCKERLAKDETSRMAVDPVSMKEVDKATAVIGADAEGNVQYFENEKNLEAFNAKAKG